MRRGGGGGRKRKKRKKKKRKKRKKKKKKREKKKKMREKKKKKKREKRDLKCYLVKMKVQFTTKNSSLNYEGSILRYISGIDLSSNQLSDEILTGLGNSIRMDSTTAADSAGEVHLEAVAFPGEEVQILEPAHRRWGRHPWMRRPAGIPGLGGPAPGGGGPLIICGPGGPMGLNCGGNRPSPPGLNCGDGAIGGGPSGVCIGCGAPLPGDLTIGGGRG
ncbi:hypothetical protein K7X08_016754 [Anisodus acutangulus]|uniref:Uncharacterized protein n=1 Tax=Anisodus acutangulus TaxID=402998 RepID=A0A9Q1LPP9_9SOLA|nr:hypothetical protein K7X08_016754 [Anisodus acutangulus]